MVTRPQFLPSVLYRGFISSVPLSGRVSRSQNNFCVIIFYSSAIKSFNRVSSLYSVSCEGGPLWNLDLTSKSLRFIALL